MKNKNIVQIYFEYVSLPFTRAKLNDFIQKNPLANTFWGIKNILREYNINAVGLKLTESELFSLPTPFFMKLDSSFDPEFVLFTKIEHNQYQYVTTTGDQSVISPEKFQKYWNGMVLYPELTSQSGENNLLSNRINVFLQKIKIPLVILSGLLVIFLQCVKKMGELNPFNILILIFYILGILTCIGLLIQDIDRNNLFVKKICQLNKKMNCSGVIESKGAKLVGRISWSEIGFIFFTGSLLINLFIPSGMPFLFWIHVLTLPYTAWSVIYQWKVVKAWCPFCLYVQLNLWLIFFALWIGKYYSLPFDFHIEIFVKTFLCYLLPTICLWFIMPFIRQSYQLPFIVYQFRKLKSNENIFHSILKEQQPLILDSIARSIVFGNPESTFTITVINNPYCHHCAMTHKRLNNLLQKYRDQIKLELIFIGDDHMEDVIKQLIAIYYNYGRESAEQIYSSWFEKGKAIFKQYPINEQNGNVNVLNDIYLAQKEWKTNKKEVVTPSIYINNFELPEEYQLEDIIYFI